MQACELFQAFIASGRQVNFDAPLVAPTRHALNPARRFAPGHERYDAMVFGLQTFCKLGHGRPFAYPETLGSATSARVLKRCHPVAMRHFLAEAHEAAELIAKGSERLEIGL